MGFNPNSLAREKVISLFNQSPVFLNWITILPGQIFFVSTLTVAEAALLLRSLFPSQFVFVAEVGQANCDGWMPREIWNFINNPSNTKNVAYGDALSEPT
jgi:hypothetical protein